MWLNLKKSSLGLKWFFAPEVTTAKVRHT